MTPTTAGRTLDSAEARRRRTEARRRYLADTFILWRRNRLMVLGTAIILGLILVALLAPFIAAQDPLSRSWGTACCRRPPGTCSAPTAWAGTSSRA